jgi:hypothetical protein
MPGAQRQRSSPIENQYPLSAIARIIAISQWGVAALRGYSNCNFALLLGEQKLGPYDVYVLRATPRPGYHPPNRDTQVLTGMQGMLWIDRNTCQWVKVEAWVVHPSIPPTGRHSHL